MSIDKEYLQNLLNFYKEKQTDLWMLQKKYNSSPLIEMEYQRTVGKIELLEELIRIIEENDIPAEKA